MTAIAVTVLHRPVEAHALDGWLAAVRAGCDRVGGFVGCVVSVHADERLELAVAVSFAREEQLSAWLGDAEWLDGAFSVGDLMMISVMQRLGSSGIVEEFPTLAAYVARGEARPAYQRAFAAQHAVFEAAQAKG